MDEYTEFLRSRRAEIVSRMDAALRRSGRGWEGITLVAVSKTVDVDCVRDAIGCGYRVFGENRPQELARKTGALAETGELEGLRFDMIGNLQTNKVNAVLGRTELIHSIGSSHLARAVSDRARRRIESGALSAPADVLLEVNVSGESTKSGFSPDELRRELDEVMELSGIRVRGLMTMAPRGDEDVARRTFSGLRELADDLARSYPPGTFQELSCGMSEDFEIALEEGSTLVRLGRVVFDPGFVLQ